MKDDSGFDYKSAINETVDVIIITDGTTRQIINVNKACCHLLGYDKSDLEGKHLSILFDNENSYSGIKSPNDICMYGSVLPNRLLKTKSGNLIPADMTINTLEGDGSSYVMISFRDIRERIRYENEILLINEQLKESNTSKDKLFSIIAHDLKNPLMALIGLSEIIYEDMNTISPEEASEIANNINKLSKDTFDLLDNLLKWATVQTKRININKTLVNLHGITSGILEILKPSADLKHITLINNVEKGKILSADKDMIKTIIRNLVSNSIKFSNAETKITVSSGNSGADNFVKVEDQGVGMEESFAANLFNSNVHTSTYGTNKEKGTGIGLLLCNEFVKLHNGDIRVISQPGKGSQFIFTLPEG